MKKINFLISLFGIILILLTFHNSLSQVNQEWVARYNGTGNSDDEARSIAVDGSGNVYVTGESSGSTIFDYATIKYNSSGDSVWVNRYSEPGNYVNFATSIAVDGSGNVYVTGFNSGGNYATIKYNSSGVIQWVQRYNGPGNSDDIAQSIAVDGSGNVYVTGSSSGSGTSIDYATIKYNSSGVTQWVQRYNGFGNFNDGAYSIVVDGSGNVYVTGYSQGNGTGDDYATIKYNSSGDSVWVKRYSGPGYNQDIAYSIAVDTSDNVYVTGSSRGTGTVSDYTTIKYNSSGDSVWVKRYNGPGNLYDDASSIAVDDSGNVYVTGSSYGSGTDFDYATIKYNSSGDSVWVQRYSGPGISSDGANAIELDGSDNIYVTGSAGGDYATIKYNSSGVQLWVQKYNGPGNSNDIAYSIAVDSSDNVYVTGKSPGSGTEDDYATIKYSQTQSISQISSIIPEQFNLSQNYPNPFNPNTIINYELRITSYAELLVYDVLGKEVEILVIEKQSPGTYQVEFNGSGLSSGVYFYRLTAGEFTDTKRMMLVK